MVELAGLGPGPFCAMVLSDLGADVVRIDRAPLAGGGDPAEPPKDVLARGRRSIALDLQHPEGADTLLRLVESADALIEVFRPGVAERLGIGPDECLSRNPRLVYGRMTGWGQDGPYSREPGHDINYIALAGVLDHVGRGEAPPTPPLNLVGDFGGGGMLLAVGIIAALLERERSGRGQVIDAAMVDGSALLMSMFHGLQAMSMWSDERGSNPLDSGAHFYDAYETADAKYVSVGSMEPKFYAALVAKLGIDEVGLPAQLDRTRWPDMKRRVAAIFRTKTRDEWCKIMEGSDVCFAPVLSMAEAPTHPHNLHRRTFVDYAGVTQAAPAPRFSRTPGSISRPPPFPGQHTDEILREAGFAAEQLSALRASGAVA